jgi:hypothetical protein
MALKEVEKRDIVSPLVVPSTLDGSKLYYPSNTTFGLVDCFFLSTEDGAIFAFQTTKRKDHAFRLATLWAFREK